MENDFLVRTSLDNQIKEAKSRAELFSKSLHDARTQEAIALKILEEERERWAHSFEEKSIMIEQLERELTFTVEALDVERSTDRMPLPKYADLKVFSNEEVEQTFHELMEEVNSDLPTFRKSSEGLSTETRHRDASNTASYNKSQAYHAGMRPNDTSFHSSNEKNNHTGYNSVAYENDGYQRAGGADYSHIQRNENNLNEQQQSRQFYSPHPSHEPQQRTQDYGLPSPSYISQSYHDPVQPLHQQHLKPQSLQHEQQRSVTPPRAEAPKADDSNLWRDLLSQYQEQLKLAKSDGAAASESRDRLTKQVVGLEQQLAKVTEERELFATSRENAEGKLTFRVAQVLQYEQEKEEQGRRIAELSSLNSDLQTQLHALRHELLVANTELRVHSSRDKDLERLSWEQRATDFGGRSVRGVLTLNAATSTDPAPGASPHVYKSEVALNEISPAARQQIQAAETHAQDLRRQVTEAHSSYGIQLDEAKKVASSLQMLLKDTERRGDDFRTRCHLAEQAATQYKAERDALLTMVSKLHLSPQAIPDAQAPVVQTVAETRGLHTPPVSFYPVLSNGNVAHHSSHTAQSAHTATPASDHTLSPALINSFSSTPHISQLDSRPQYDDPVLPHQDLAKVQGIAVVPFLSRSEDFAVRQGLSDQPEHGVDDADSSLEVDSDCDDALKPSGSTTGSVLDMAAADQLRTGSLESADHWPVSQANASAPQFVTHASGRNRVSLHGMLAASSDTVRSKKSTSAPSSSRRARTGSGEGQSIQKSKSKSKSPTAASHSSKRAEAARLPAPAVGQPGKSMVIRKPPSYTGASNEHVRGANSPLETGQSNTKPHSSARVVKKAASTSPRASRTPSSLAQTGGTDVPANKATTPILAVASLDRKDFVPASYSNRNDVSWESEVSRADTSGLSHDVDDFADADAHFEQQPTDDEERTDLDPADLTMRNFATDGTMNYLPPPSQPLPVSHRYYEGDEYFEGEDEESESEGEESSGAEQEDVVLHHTRDIPLPPQMSASVERDLLDHTVEFTRMQNSLGDRGYRVHDLHEAPRDASHPEKSTLQARTRSGSINSASASVASAGTDRSSRRGSGGVKQSKFSGITDIKISRKAARDVPSVQPRIPATTKVTTGLRTPSPMTRGTVGGSGRSATKASSLAAVAKNTTSKRAGSTPRTRIPTAAVVTPVTSDSRRRIISATGSVLKKNPKDRIVPGSASRQRSLMY